MVRRTMAVEIRSHMEVESLEAVVVVLTDILLMSLELVEVLVEVEEGVLVEGWLTVGFLTGEEM